MRTSESESRLSIRVQPRSSRNAIAGWTGTTLKMSLTAPPVDGAANAACLAFLAHLLDMPASRLSLLKGARSRTKLVRLRGMNQEEVDRRLRRHVPMPAGERSETASR
jgi:uncharacterized protein